MIMKIVKFRDREVMGKIVFSHDDFGKNADGLPYIVKLYKIYWAIPLPMVEKHFRFMHEAEKEIEEILQSDGCKVLGCDRR